MSGFLHNIQNALGAIGVAKSLGLGNKSIAEALQQFSSNIDDNPGRGNQFEVNGAQVIMDFAHNVHSMDAMAVTVANMPAERKFLMLSMALSGYGIYRMGRRISACFAIK